MFATIPAIDVKKIPFLYSLNLSGFIGTGLAQPKPKIKSDIKLSQGDILRK